jgi:hypothetical protein
MQLVDMGFLSKSSSWGLGKHDRDMTPEQLINAGKWAWLYMIPGCFVAVLARISGGVFLIRLFGIHEWLKRYLIVFTVLQAIGGMLVLLTNFLAITPIEALWNPTIPDKRARYSPQVASITAYTTQSLFTMADLTYVLFPVIIVWNLHLNMKKKIGIILLMCTSLITMAVSIMKAITLAKVSGVAEPAYTSSLSALWAGLEQTLVIIMASVPALSAITKLNLGIRRLTSSIAKSLNLSGGRTGNDSKGSKLTNSTADSMAGMKPARGYQDLEKNSFGSHNNRHGNQVAGSPFGSAVAYYDESNEMVPLKSTASVRVRRTDEYTVEYDRRP